MPSPRSSKLSGTVYWPNGTTLFQGFVAVALVMPVENGSLAPVWPRLTLDRGYPSIQVPIWTKINITDGVFDQNISLWYNGDLKPYGSTYVAYYYDSAGVDVGAATNQFSVSAPTTAIPQAITVSPSAGTTIPVPLEVF